MDLGGSIRRRRKGPARAKAKQGKRASGKRTGANARAARVRAGRSAARAWLTALLVAAAGLGAGYLVAVTLVFPVPDTTVELQAVPDVRGRPVAFALSELADSGLVVGRVDSVRHPLAPAGTVMGQSPLPGFTARARAPVRVTVSTGREVRPVPDLTRLDGVRAAELLAAGGFVVQVDTVESNVAAGKVLDMDPEPGTEVPLPAGIRLAVSAGPPTFLMPDLAGMTQGEAFALLRALGLTMGEIDRRYSFLNVRTIFGQYPEPHDLVTEGTQVRLIVGREVVWQ